MNEEGMMIDDQVPKFPSRHKNITITITINQSLDENRGGGTLAVHSFVYGEDCLALYCIALHSVCFI